MDWVERFERVPLRLRRLSPADSAPEARQAGALLLGQTKLRADQPSAATTSSATPSQRGGMVANLDGWSWFGLAVYILVSKCKAIEPTLLAGNSVTSSAGTAALSMRENDHTLTIFLVAVVFVIRPVRVPIPARLSRALLRLLAKLRLAEPSPAPAPLSLPLDLRTAPLAGVILLLITTTIPGSVLRQGIVGTAESKPYDVLVLFISLVSTAPALAVSSRR